MTIIDGNVGYMGGINLADEYINKKVRSATGRTPASCCGVREQPI
ncbi:MAG: hypothetical protein ACLT4C_01060 [Butyricicoccus sp.]